MLSNHTRGGGCKIQHFSATCSSRRKPRASRSIKSQALIFRLAFDEGAASSPRTEVLLIPNRLARAGPPSYHLLGQVDADRGRRTGLSLAISNATLVVLDGQQAGSLAL